MAEKGTVVVGCDINSGQDSNFQNTVCEKLESAGYTVEKLQIAPNPFAAYSYSGKAQGKYGVYIIAAGTYSIADYHYGANKNKNSFKMAVFPIRTDLNSKLQGDNWDEYPIGADADYSGLPRDIVGKTFKQMNEMLKEDVRIVRGNTPDEMAKNVLAALGGQVSDDDKGSSGSTIKDAIKQLLAAWDGEVECKCINEYVYINKIQDPHESVKYVLMEGGNIIDDSVTINDYNPDTVNFLTVHWQGGEDIVYRDEKLIARFGEKPLELDAVKKVTVTEEKETTSTDTSTTSTDTSDSSVETTEDTSTDTSTTTTTTTETKTEEIPVETLEEAEAFARIEWAKIKRDDGHTLECKVLGSERWHPGEWAKVILPSFDLEDYMYITAVSQTEDNNGDWTANVNLSDYPPSLGTETESTDDEEEEEETDEELEEDTLDTETTE